MSYVPEYAVFVYTVVQTEIIYTIVVKTTGYGFSVTLQHSIA